MPPVLHRKAAHPGHPGSRRSLQQAVRDQAGGAAGREGGGRSGPQAGRERPPRHLRGPRPRLPRRAVRSGADAAGTRGEGRQARSDLRGLRRVRDENAADRRRRPGVLRRADHRHRRERGIRGALPELPRGTAARRPSHRDLERTVNPPTAYGGQAVIEGVMIRGRRTVALACRLRTGEIYRYREPLRSVLLRSAVARAPFVRGLIVLWESLSYGTRMLMRSADLQLEEGEGGVGSGSNAVIFAVAIVAALAFFVGIPYLATQAARQLIESSLVLNIAEGLLRMALFLGYLAAISLAPDIRRVFMYHGAEHMTIHAFEHGEELVPARIKPYPTAHPRCGTAFLLFVVVVSIALFAFLPRTNIVVDLVARLLLIIPVASISYEVLRFGAAHEANPVMRVFVAPGLLLQRITTRRPDAGMIEVAVASLEEALAGDAEAAGKTPAPSQP